MKLTICTLIAGIAAATAAQASDTRVFGERIMLPENGSSTAGLISADGSAVLGNSTADYLIPNDLNGTASDTFYLNTASKEYVLASLDRSGSQGSAFFPVGLSSDGSVALMADVYDGKVATIFRRDTRTTEYLPISEPKAISGDGNIVAYMEKAEDGSYIGLYNLSTSESERVPIPTHPTAAVSLSKDGRYVAFGTKSAIYRFDVQNASIEQVPIAASSDKFMGTISEDGNLLTYSAIFAGGFVYNFATGKTEMFCKAASNTAISGNGRFAACDWSRKAITVKDLTTGEAKTLDTAGGIFFALGGVSNSGTVVWGSPQPGTAYDNNGKSDLFITTF